MREYTGYVNNPVHNCDWDLSTRLKLNNYGLFNVMAVIRIYSNPSPPLWTTWGGGDINMGPTILTWRPE